MSLLDSLIGIIVPHECLGCSTEGSLLCQECASSLPPVPKSCYICRRYSPGGQTCRDCSAISILSSTQIAAVYEGLAKDLIWKLKSSGAQAAAKVMAGQVINKLNLPDNTLIVPVPTATSRVRQRGYDQSKLFAKSIARQSGLTYLNCLARVGHVHQVGATRQQRLKQLDDAYYVKRPRLIRDAHITLVDDVVTTGSTLRTAAHVLKTAGAASVDAVVFAQAKPRADPGL